MIRDAAKVRPKIDVKQFRSLGEEEQYRYIYDRFHLAFYSDCSGEALNDSRRVIGLVKRQAPREDAPESADGGYWYYAYPIDCLDDEENFERSVLFKDARNRFRVRIPNWNEKSVQAAQKACEEVDQNDWGQKMVSMEYHIAPRDTWIPIWVSDVHVLDCSPAEMHERIKKICAEAKTLTGAISQLEAKCQELEQQREGQEKQLEEVRANLEAERRELEGQQEAREQLMRALKEEADRKKRAEDALSALDAEACAFAGRLQAYGLEVDREALGLCLPAEQPPERCAGESVPDERKLILDLPLLAAQVRDAISKDQKLYYEEHVIREFLGAMFTDQIIILSGPPGTGKSSLPPAVARCIGAECRMVSVQPSWTDNQDLLGFYDPARERFVATPFLDILVEAKNDPSTIYLVCLDEMNLVRVEYYFSEILSAMETEKKELRLYSPYIYDLRRKTLRRQLGAMSKLEPGPEAVEKLHAAQDALELLDRYAAVFPLPDNVQFIGTLNVDETTKGLSPKVLDRSFIIEIDRRAPSAGAAAPGSIQDGTPQAGSPPSGPVSSFVPSAFRRGVLCGLAEGGLEARKRALGGLMAKLKEQLEEAEYSQQISVSLSARGQAHVDKLFRRGLEPDDVFLGKVLSAMRYTAPELDGLIQKQAGEAYERLAAARGRDD